MNKKKIGLIVILVVLITSLHYFTSPANAPMHEIYREMYFIPAILAGLWGGKRKGFATSTLITLLFLPHVFHAMATTWSTLLVNISEILLLNLAGLFAGAYKDTRQGYLRTMNTPYYPTKVREKFLLFVDGTPASLYAANYFVNIFGKVPDIGITLLWLFSHGQEEDFFETTEEAASYVREEFYKGQEILRRAKDILLTGGIHESKIHEQIVAVDKKAKISDQILEEVRNGSYDTIIIGKHSRSKAQEFLFGSTTIALVRDTLVNVVAVKVPEEAEKMGVNLQGVPSEEYVGQP